MWLGSIPPRIAGQYCKNFGRQVAGGQRVEVARVGGWWSGGGHLGLGRQ